MLREGLASEENLMVDMEPSEDRRFNQKGNFGVGIT